MLKRKLYKRKNECMILVITEIIHGLMSSKTRCFVLVFKDGKWYENFNNVMEAEAFLMGVHSSMWISECSPGHVEWIKNIIFQIVKTNKRVVWVYE